MSINPFRHLWRPIRHYFMISAAPGRYIWRPKPLTSDTQDLRSLLRNNQGQNVALSSLANFETDYGPEFTLRYNEYRGAADLGSAARYSLNRPTGPRKMFSIKHAPRNGLRYMGVLSGAEARQGVPAWAISHSLLFVSDSCGTLRKLTVALQRPAEHSCRRYSAPRNPVAASLCNRLTCRHTWSRWRTMLHPRLGW